MARADLALLLLFLVLRWGKSEILFPCEWDEQCKWVWKESEDGLIKTTGQQLTTNQKTIGPAKDANGSENGFFLYLPGFRHPPPHFFNLTSPLLNASESGQCRLLFSEHSASAAPDSIKLVILGSGLPVDVGKHHVSSQNSWRNVNQRLGKILYPFQVVIEFIPSNISYSHVAIDNLRLENCTSESDHKPGACVGQNQFECDNKKCIDQSRVCDLHVDCPTGEDEGKICDKIPRHASCDFETVGDEMCGWSNDQNDQLEWIRKQGVRVDNPYESPRGRIDDTTFKNGSGHYLYKFQMTDSKMMEKATLNSATFEPPPKCHGQIHSAYFNSCQIRFYYYMSDSAAGDLNLHCIEKPPGLDEINSFVWGKSERQREKWIRVAMPLPRLQYKFHLQFVGTRGRVRSDIAIDDISLSPQCFGIGIPDNLTENCENSVVDSKSDGTKSMFPRIYKVYKFNTCGAKGRFGPTSVMCNATYFSSEISVNVTNEGNMSGIQSWTVNKTGIYSVLARGASGGKGARSTRRSHGMTVRGVFNWAMGDVIYMLIGQQGSSSCQWTHCTMPSHRPTGIQGLAHVTKHAMNKGSGGGGGGATFVFQLDDVNRPKPLLVAAGGGGFSLDPSFSDQFYNPDGRPDNKSALPNSGTGYPTGAGGGGGWSLVQETNLTEFPSAGLSLLEGGVGGKPCVSMINWEASGGFGGGGGACQSGGGGGGYAGGNAYYPDHSEQDGQGGVSFVSGAHGSAYGSSSESPGRVDVFPAFEGCGCSFLCVILDPETHEFTCICQENWQLANDNVSCEVLPGVPGGLEMQRHLLILLLCVAVLLICIGTVIFFSYHRYRRQKMKSLRQELFGNAELQLNRLRQHTGGMITEYNPNYEFGGSTCTIQDLKEVPRDSLNLVKPLGQGAFGEVYQGSLTAVPDEARDLPVAVKTLPELSSAQAEMDFLMEALIMSKFNHPNIVRFIGVCFEKLPKFIVLELLPGGDLKSFLREQRPKPDRPSPLTMCDLLLLAIDVARGCRYLEENHFIHRDIAARNCLLSSKDANRVVKIADFGMARDIYRADYYRKGGKAMLPVKWMPPEAFLDGIFTSKTDVWSFGVLLWEVMSLGYMPYPGRGNQEVMQLVTSGGRLEPPNNCPSPVYHIMVQCWNSIPDDRPNFVTILERLGYCLQDPDVISAALPVFHRPPSMERDTTVMRPPDSEDRLLQVQRPLESEPLSPSSTDYLIPIPASNYSLSTEKTDLASSVDSIDKLLELDEHRVPAPPAPSPVAPQTAKRRSGGYTSIPMAEDVTPNNVMDVWQRAPQNNAPVNKTSLPLDASMLGKQQNALPYPYMNVSVAAKAPPLDHKIDPFIIGNHYTEKEVNC